jgi:hypothetical protein
MPALVVALLLQAADGGVALTVAPTTAAETAPAPAPRPQPTASAWVPQLVRFTTWDLQLEGGPGLSWDSSRRLRGLVRARVGVLHVDNDWHVSAGLLGEWRSADVFALGVQGEVLHLEQGLWAQLGLALDVLPTARPGAMVSVGLSLLGAELQLRPEVPGASAELALFLKLRVPVRHLLLALGLRPTNQALRP